MSDASADAATEKRKAYHHGNLTDALIAATVEIIEERGVEHVSVREAARRAGVSPGAPFRHFSSRTALLKAVGEQAMERLTQAVDRELAANDKKRPTERFAAIGAAYLDWALSNPTHFQIISSREIMDFEASSPVRAQNDDIRVAMARLLREMQADGALADEADIDLILLSARAHVYGLARMAVDGHFAEWTPSGTPLEAANRSLNLFLSALFTQYGC